MVSLFFYVVSFSFLASASASAYRHHRIDVRAQPPLGSFPDSESPVSASPPIVATGKRIRDCVLIENAALQSYGQLAQREYRGAECVGGDRARVGQIILTFEGAVKGVQFDRYGAFWLGNVELLRTTTPEPTPIGIEWKTQRDVSEYISLFASQVPLNATLSIPNVVNPTYTGVLMVNITISLFEAAPEAAALPDKTIRSLAMPFASAGGPWNAITLSGNASQVHSTKLGVRNAKGIWVDIYASGHQCEEFWYTNVIDSVAPSFGACGGGAFRMIQLFVDNTILACTADPYPVVYSGGINPLLWRPLAGIESFDIPPYRCDLTPFAGLLNDGKNHNISFRVAGNNNKGVWYVDPILIIEVDPTKTIVEGAFTHKLFKPLNVAVTTKNETGGTTFITTAELHYAIDGWVGHSSNAKSIEYIHKSLNVNAFQGSDLQITHGNMKSAIIGPTYRNSKYDFPYSVWLKSSQDASTFQIDANVSFARIRSEVVNETLLHWDNAIRATATYNRSLSNHSAVNIMSGNASENFLIKYKGKYCFNTTLVGKSGDLTAVSRGNISDCAVRFCGQDVCHVR